MIELPLPFQNKEFDFILCINKSKHPTESGKRVLRKFNDDILLKHLQSGGNVGLNANGTYVFIDIDVLDEKLKEIMDSYQTYCQQSGSGGFHYIFKLKTPYYKNHLLNGGIGELRTNNWYILIPPSIHPNGNAYKILNDGKIKEVETTKFLQSIKQFITDSKENNMGDIDIIEQFPSSIEEIDKKIIPFVNSRIRELIFLDLPKGDVRLKTEYQIPSRSERDLKIVTQLILKGFENYIEALFKLYPCGNKYREHSSPDKYLQYTIKKAKGFTGVKNPLYITLEDDIQTGNEKWIRLHLDEYLVKITQIESEELKQYFISSLALKTKIKQETLMKKMKKLKNTKDREHIVPIDVNELLEQEDLPLEYYIKPFIPQGFNIMIAAYPGTGKSLLSQIFCLYICGNKKYFLDHPNYPVFENSKILYYDLENSINPVKSRLKFLVKGMDFENIKGFSIMNSFCKDSLEEEISRCKEYDIIVLDSYRRFYDGSENDSEVTNTFYNNFLKKLNDLGKTTIVIHHLNKMKRGDDSYNVNSIRGSTDINAQFDLIYAINSIEEIRENVLKLTMFFNKTKNRYGIIIPDMKLDITKNDFERKTSVVFAGNESYTNKKDFSKNLKEEAVLNYIKENKEVSVSQLQSEFNQIPPRSLSRYVATLEKEESIISDKRGFYKVYDIKEDNKKEEVKQTELQ